jgi:hypothetical protein
MPRTIDLGNLLRQRCKELGNAGAKAYFGVSERSIKYWTSGKTSEQVDAIQRVLDETHAGIDPLDVTLSDWSGTKVNIAMPSRGTVSPETMFSILALMDKYPPLPDGVDDKGDTIYRRRLGFDIEVSTLVVHARNILATRFLKTDAEWQLWIDDDMLIPCGKPGAMMARFNCGYGEPWVGVDAISRLLYAAERCKATIVGGLYFGRHTGGRGMFAEALRDDAVNRDCHTAPRNEAKKVEWTATGCMLVHRTVYEDILEHFPEVRAKTAVKDAAGQPLDVYGFFTPFATAQGEDAAFGKRANEAGHQSWVDFGCVCGHIGHKAYWHHNTIT